ncbi:ABC transporter permease [Clostridium sp. Marseille-P3244]|uniref:ABC transporter permease n=1 Tax=Clostridium sp. Marseille-P3244 TaxID=1871020 RepID=UPI000930B1AD|nr:ABC transporter permease [Clostridium sp. Marseille-P3244]
MRELELFLATALGTMTPILATAIGGAYAEKSRTTNIGMEGMMLISAFFSMVIGFQAKSAWIGLLGGIGCSVLVAFIFALMVFRLDCDKIIGGIGLNLFASGLTLLLMTVWFNEPGTYKPKGMPTLPTVEIPLLEKIPIIGPALNGQSILFFITIVLVFIFRYVMEKTRYGYWVRAVGENEDAAIAAGIPAVKVRISTLLISGFTAGIGGAFLSISTLGLYSHNMTSDRGFIALAATIFGNGRIGGTAIAAMIFGTAEGAAIRLQSENMPIQILNMLPYVATIAALVIYGLRKKRKGEKEDLESYVPSIVPKD